VHELGIAQAIVDRAREAALANGVRHVSGIYLAMTPAADFTEDALAMYLEMLTEDDELLRGAQVRVERRPVDARCLECGCEFSVRERSPSCPECSSLLVGLDSGAAMVQLTHIEADDEGEEEGGGGA
jgi:Zn finger protein HypA/HybF involved in hydrogenase expression